MAKWLQEKRECCEHCKAKSACIHVSDCFCPLPQHSYEKVFRCQSVPNA